MACQRICEGKRLHREDGDPFCTSASSALGQSGETLSQLAGTGDWQEGQRFGSSAARSDVADWLTGLGFTVR